MEKRVRGMFTDPNRIRADIPGRVEGNPVFIYHDAFNDNALEVADLKDRYSKGKVGDVEVKKKLTAAINKVLRPIREKRSYFEKRRDEVKDIIKQGTIKAKNDAHENMKEILDHIGMYRPL